MERLSLLAWEYRSSKANAALARFLKEFRDAPHRSEQARSCVDRLCDRVLRWFAAAAAENLVPWDGSSRGDVARRRGHGFIYAASFVGHLIACGLFDHDLVRRHLIKPLITHQYATPDDVGRFFRAMAIYHVTARDTLLQGFLEPEDVEACFKTFDAEVPPGGFVGPDLAKQMYSPPLVPVIHVGIRLLIYDQELREFHATWLRRKEEEQRAAAAVQEPEREVGSDGMAVAAEVPVEIETSAAFAPQDDLPTAVDIGIPPSVFRDIESLSLFRNVDTSSATYTGNRTTAASSPTLSISTMSDLTPTETDGDTGENDSEGMATRHETFYLEDGNVEVVCGHTIFRSTPPLSRFPLPNSEICFPRLPSSTHRCHLDVLGLFPRTALRILQSY